MNQDDRVGDQTLDLVSDSMEIDRRPRGGVHHVDQDLHGDVRWEFGTRRRKPADTWVRNPVPIQDAENLVAVKIEEVEWSEVAGHTVMVPHQSTQADVAVSADWEHSPVTTKRSDYGSLTQRTNRATDPEPDRPLPEGAHVWVRAGTQEVPGLLAGWRQGPDGWWGRVVTVTDGQPSESLIRADLLRKA